MGDRDKLLERVHGHAILAVLAKRALSVAPTFVTLPSLDHPRRAVLPDAAQLVIVDGQMSDSIQAGIAALPDDTRGVMILPADMPDITSSDMRLIQTAAQNTDAPIVRASTADGLAGHPIYFASCQFAKFSDLKGDHGAFSLTKGLERETVLIPLEGDRARLDLDTPEDWANYNAQ